MERKTDSSSAFLFPRIAIVLTSLTTFGLIALALQSGTTREIGTGDLPLDQINAAQGIVVSVKQIPLSEIERADFVPNAVTSPFKDQKPAIQGSVPLALIRFDPMQTSPTPTPPGALVLLDTFTGQPTTTFTGSTPRTYMGDGFMPATLPGGTTYVNVRSYTFYMVAATNATYTDVRARLVLWNTYNQTTTAVTQFSNQAAFFDVDLGPITVTNAPAYFAINVEALPPYAFLAVTGAQWGYAQNFQSSTTGDPVADNPNLTSLITANASGGGAYPAGQITSGTSPNFGYYRNVSGLTTFNFLGTDFRSLGLVSQAVGIILRGDPQTSPTPIIEYTATPTPSIAPTPATPTPSLSPTPTPGTPAPTPPPSPTPTPPGSVVLLDTVSNATASFVPSVTDRTYMGDGFTNNALPIGTEWFRVRSLSFFFSSATTQTYASLVCRLQLWNTYVPSNTPVFANPAGLVSVDIGPASLSPSNNYRTDITLPEPGIVLMGGSGTQWGWGQNVLGDSGAGLVATSVLSVPVASCASCGGTYAAGQITTGSPPNYGYYRNTSGRTDFNFNPGDAGSLGSVTQGVKVILRGDPGSGPTPTPAPPTPTPTPGTPVPTVSPTPPPPVCGMPASGFVNFDNLASLGLLGWLMKNNSSPVGTTGWFQGQTSTFTSQAGPPNSYIAANYQNTLGASTISNWLLLPPLELHTGGYLAFWSRTVSSPAFPDRLQVRMSTNGDSSNVGSGPTDVGDFTTLLLDINPTYTTNGYPQVWTQYVAWIPSFIHTTGRVAFRYFVENGGPNGVNSDYIGIDSLQYACAHCDFCATPTPTPTSTPTPTPTSTPGPNGCNWSLGAAFPIPIMDNAVASVGGNLYSFAGVSNNSVVSNAYRFDGASWTQIANVPLALEGAAAATDGTNVYIVGGADDNGSSVTSLYRYNIGTNTYSLLAPCAVASWNHVLVYLNGKLYKVAGTDDAPNSLSNVEIYDIAANTWSTGASYPIAASFPMAFTQGGFIYVGGGIDANTSAEITKTYRYDPGTNTWTDAAIADLPVARWGGASSFGSCCTGGGVFAGGYVNGTISFTAISWDSGTNTWSSIPNLVGERSRMNGAMLNGKFFVVGGRSNSVDAFVGTSTNHGLSCLSMVTIDGTVQLCAGATSISPANVSMTLTGSSGGSVVTDGSGAYQFIGLAPGGNFTVTPTRAARIPGSPGINTVDVIAEQNHALNRVLLSGCRLLAGECAGAPGITTVDVLAIQSFALGRTTANGNVGKYSFTPTSRSYAPLNTNQNAQNYDAIVFGDVANPVANP